MKQNIKISFFFQVGGLGISNLILSCIGSKMIFDVLLRVSEHWPTHVVEYQACHTLWGTTDLAELVGNGCQWNLSDFAARHRRSTAATWKLGRRQKNKILPRSWPRGWPRTWWGSRRKTGGLWGLPGAAGCSRASTGSPRRPEIKLASITHCQISLFLLVHQVPVCCQKVNGSNNQKKGWLSQTLNSVNLN